MNIPERTRFIGDEDPLQIWWFISGALVNFGAGYTFSAKLAPTSDPASSVFVKTTGFTGAAGTGTERDGTPNLTIDFNVTGELNGLTPGQYLLEIVANKTADSKQKTLQMTLDMRSRLGPVVGPPDLDGIPVDWIDPTLITAEDIANILIDLGIMAPS